MVYKKVKRNEGEGQTGVDGEKKTVGQGPKPMSAADLKKQASFNSKNRFSSFEWNLEAWEITRVKEVFGRFMEEKRQ
jgi:hypothetical protein